MLALADPTPRSLALEEAGEAARGATLYVTLEPCCHHGKTPPCTDAILQAGIARVVAAIRDPFPRVDGGGVAILREAGVKVQLGVLASQAAELNAPYLKRLATGLPYVTAKWAMTLDGKTVGRFGPEPVDLLASLSLAGPRAQGPDGRDRRRYRHRAGRRPPAHRSPARPPDAPAHHP